VLEWCERRPLHWRLYERPSWMTIDRNYTRDTTSGQEGLDCSVRFAIDPQMPLL